ncbi:MAG TPA: prenyltransferase, partial [Burkholderiales bacterium]|nr:prenyltransferase [Burkholderiales bacterium]
MGISLNAPPHAGTQHSPWRRVLLVFSLVRYRFFLFAGLVPYLLGAAWGYAVAGEFDALLFWGGLGGVVLAVIGVESFNEFFDAQMGTDRVFNPDDVPPVARAVFWIGTLAFAGAAAIGVYLAWRLGWPILAFALVGGAAAIFYEAPPIRWSYRGLGELAIALSYGPGMVLGSLYLHTRAVSWGAFWAS